MSDTPIAWQGEAMLLNWQESSTRGRTITLLLPEDDETHPFKDFGIKSGKRAGQRFMAVFVQLTDDDQPQEKPLSQDAGALCRDTDFWVWANGQTLDTINSEQTARDWLCERLSISSRSELATDRRAASEYRQLVSEYRQSRAVFR